MRDTPRVSVILPTRDRAGSLEVAVRSVLDGSFRDLEVVVIDDASSDATLEVLAAVDDPRLRVLTLGRPGGAAAARNVGLEAAAGELVAFQDSDDEWTPGHLDVLVEALDRGGADVGLVYGRSVSVSGVQRPGDQDTEVSGDLRSVLARYNIIDLPATVIRANVLRSVGGFTPELPRLQDWDVFLSIARRYRMEFVDVTVVRSGEPPDQISADRDRYYVALELVLKRHRELFEAEPLISVAHRMQLARWRAARRDHARAVEHTVACLRHPIMWGRWFRERAIRRTSPVGRRDAPGDYG